MWRVRGIGCGRDIQNARAGGAPKRTYLISSRKDQESKDLSKSNVISSVVSRAAELASIIVFAPFMIAMSCVCLMTAEEKVLDRANEHWITPHSISTPMSSE